MKKWLKILLVILSFAAISAVLFLIFKAIGITSISKLRSIISQSGRYGCVVYTIILAVALIAFCFVPLLNTTLAILGIALFGAKIAFITNIIAVFISTSVLFFIGDKFGEKFAVKLIGKKSLEETQNSIDHKSKFWLPILFITPGIPDEAICLVAGMTKMKYWYLILISLIYHSVEIGLFCFFGSSLIDWASLTLIDWIVVVNLFIVDLFLIVQLEKAFFAKKHKKQ